MHISSTPHTPARSHKCMTIVLFSKPAESALNLHPHPLLVHMLMTNKTSIRHIVISLYYYYTWEKTVHQRIISVLFSNINFMRDITIINWKNEVWSKEHLRRKEVGSSNPGTPGISSLADLEGEEEEDEVLLWVWEVELRPKVLMIILPHLNSPDRTISNTKAQ